MSSLKIQLQDLFSEGSDKVHVVADFDGTLTKEYVNGVHTPSLSEVLRSTPGILPEAYQKQSHAYYSKYTAILNNDAIPFLERKAAMQEWWESIEQLNIEFELHRSHMALIASSDMVELRDDASAFIQNLVDKSIPLIIFSASGFGNAIRGVMQKHQLDSENVRYVTNIMNWGEDGKALGYHRPLIHALNKDETAIHSFPEIERLIKGRYNVLLLGNSVGDLGMAKGHRVDKLFTVGFLDKEDAHKKAFFEKNFDLTIVGDDFVPLVEALRDLQSS